MKFKYDAYIYIATRRPIRIRNVIIAGKEGIAMLVLSRKRNESVVINDNITVVVVDVRGDKVRLGINAPKNVPVHRKEIYDSIRNIKLSENVTVNTH
jgi:carbon storage regulator